ncbi:hypothetical protein Pmani_031326 [Petrolisthes manimaculis]|uniref:Uncharacterized protein n=1 Tax=Petrolisthes manimaculis TaxID=1843537 RepID=A0AAE1TV04_9EUCA|nr:hypothetical protein Pmani_031326 [Petrolisthes manimaculis]
MKNLVFVLAAAVTVASAQFMQQQAASPNTFQGGNQGVGFGRSVGGVGGGGNMRGNTNWERLLPEPINYGPKVYGPGAMNRYAIQPNPFQMRRALNLVQNNPNAFVRVEMDGDIELTNQHGMELTARGPFGQKIDLDF